MYEIMTLGELSDRDKKRVDRKQFSFSEETPQPDAIFVRSATVANEKITPELLTIGRAGIGLNTIDVAACTQNGTMVFNTPGVNSNAVKELVLTNLLNAVRPVEAAVQNVQHLSGDNILEQAENLRNDFLGEELEGKTIGILGLGAIGDLVAKACHHLGMDVLGYARRPRQADYFQQVYELRDLLPEADFVVILLPLTDDTKQLIGKKELAMMRSDALLLNFGRGEIVDDQALLQALEEEQIAGYVSDFPNERLLHQPKIKLLPHMGGTTNKALSDGAAIVVRNIRDFLLYGTVRQSVNFPNTFLPLTAPIRLSIFFIEQPKLFAKISQTIAEQDIEIDILTSERRNGYVYSLIDLDETDETKVEKLKERILQLDGILRIRLLKNPNWTPIIYL